MKEEFNFDLTVIEIPVNFTHEDGTKENYILREMDGSTRGKYIDFVLENSDEDGNVESLEKLETMVLHLSLFDPKGKNAPLEKVKYLPSRVRAPLYHKAREISGLDEEAKNTAKNDSEEKGSSGSN